MTKQVSLRFVGEGTLAEGGEEIRSGMTFTVSADRADELLGDPFAEVKKVKAGGKAKTETGKGK